MRGSSGNNSAHMTESDGSRFQLAEINDRLSKQIEDNLRLLENVNGELQQKDQNLVLTAQ